MLSFLAPQTEMLLAFSAVCEFAFKPHYLEVLFIMAAINASTDNQSPDVLNLSLQDTSMELKDKKYRLKNKQDEAIDVTLDDTYKRLACALCALENQSDRDYWYKAFLWALRQGAIPSSAVISSLGAAGQQANRSLLNCAVSGTIQDSMDDILTKAREAGLTLKSGCRLSYDFSTLRPKGAFVADTPTQTSGPLAFMAIYNKIAATISCKDKCRPSLASLDIRHPDVIEFINAKQENGYLSQFNLALLITDNFLDAVKNDRPWSLVFPISQKEILKNKIKINQDSTIIWTDWPHKEGFIEDTEGRVACKIYHTLAARQLWQLIMENLHGMNKLQLIFIDKINEMNNNWFCEDIYTTNPNGDQPLPPYGASLLGAIDLTRYVNEPFTQHARFDWALLRKTVTIFTRMLDNLVDINKLPLAQQQAEIIEKRRHGMGFLGLGSTFSMLGYKYGDLASIQFAEQVAKEIAIIGWEQAISLAEEKGPAPLMEKEFSVTAKMLRKRPEMKKDGFKLGDKIKGKLLIAKYSRYMQKLNLERPDLIEKLVQKGGRFTHHSSIMQADTLTSAFSNKVTDGIAPYVGYHGANLAQEQNLDEITPEHQLEIQAATQTWIDSAIATPIGFPTDFAFDTFNGFYMDAHNKGLKGCAPFRIEPEGFQRTFVKKSKQDSPLYVFTLENGTTFEAKGDEIIEYEGKIQTAANLYDVLKKGD